MPSGYPANDEQFVNWLTNFISVATANAVVLGYTDAILEPLITLRDDLQVGIEAENTARDAAKAATAQKDNLRRAANLQASFRTKTILANPNLPVSLKEALGLNVPSPPVASAPRIPADLAVNPQATGVNVLTWKTNGNTGTTQYVVEQKRSQLGPWHMVGTTTTRTFIHTGQVPGQHVIYRIRAQKKTIQSQPSNAATAYPNSAFPSHDNGITT